MNKYCCTYISSYTMKINIDIIHPSCIMRNTFSFLKKCLLSLYNLLCNIKIIIVII